MQQKLRRTIVKKMICVTAFVVALFSMAVAQNSAPATAALNVLQHGQSTSNVKSPSTPFCKGSSCLYYAGDFPPTDSSPNVFFNANYTAAGEVGQVWVGVKPTKAAT